jgi:pimeloyl-ACP methyl ester carboxylesterase
LRIEIEPGVRLFIDIEGLGLVPDGPTLRRRPTLVLLHGGPGFDHSTGKATLGSLAEIAQIVYYDHRGHGRSDPRPRSEWTLDTWADDVVRLCDALGIVKPIVMGQSFGGMVAQHYIARHPAHAAKVIISSTSHNLGLERKLAMFERLGGPHARAVAQQMWTDPTPEHMQTYDAVCMPLYNTRRQDPNIGARTLRNLDILMHWMRGESRTMDLRPGLARAQCPVLVLAGVQDPVCPLEDGREIAAALPRQLTRFEAFERAGHGVWRDDPEAALPLLRQFILE